MTVSKRKDTGQWVCDFYHNGERIRKALKFARTKKEAEQAEAVIMNQVFQQVYGFEPKSNKLFEEFIIENFLPYSEANKKSFANDVSICRVLVLYFRGKSIRQITPTLVEEFKQWFLAKPTRHGTKRSLATVNNHLRVLSKVFSLAVDADLIEANPCFRVRKFKPNNRRLRVLSDAEESELLAKLKGKDLLRSIVIFALHTGMRRGEIFDLQWADVDFERRRLIVRKTKASKERFVPMNATVSELLRSLPRPLSEYVFASPHTAGRLTDIKKGFRSAALKAEIENLRFHDLRHTFATRLADAGTDAYTLMEILGHADIKTTMIYVHASAEAGRSAVEKLDTKWQFSHVLVTEKKTADANLP
jgi:integrase